jgi:L-fucose mutarotase
MGHGDEIVLGDANFPSESVASSTPFGIIRCDGLNIPELLEAILKLLPLDFSARPCYLMALMPEHEKACKQIRATVA